MPKSLKQIKVPKIKRVRPKYTPMTTMPAIYWDHQSIKFVKEFFGKWPERMENGRVLVLLDMATFCRNAVRKKAPLIDGTDYAQDLKIGVIDGVPSGEDWVAIYYQGKIGVVRDEERSRVLMYVQPGRDAPKYAWVLNKYNPWPAALLPMRPEKDTVIVARYSNATEISYYENVINSNSTKIENELHSAGAHGVKIATGKGPGKVDAFLDVGHTVLQREFGHEGESKPHWRPSLKLLQKYMPKLLKKYVKYVETGKASVFDIEEDEGLSVGEFMSGAKFFRTIAPFAPSQFRKG